MVFTGIMGWIVFGLIAGYVASTMVNRRCEGLPMDLVLGTVGAVIGGAFFNTFGVTGVTGFSAWSLLAAVIGAMLFLWAWHAKRRSAPHA